MKKTVLLSALAAATLSASAQLALTTSPYTQNFNSITSALPTGWYGYVSSTAASAGTVSVYSGSVNYGVFADTVESGGSCKANIFDGSFKNYPSANTVTKGATCSAQKLITDRAFGLRQTGTTSFPGADPGAAFVFKLAGTNGGTNFSLSFKLQSLDTTSGKSTNWTVDYGIGSTPTSFTPVTTSPATLTTGNFMFSNTPVTVNFGSALDNKSSNVWIRIVALSASTGTPGDRRASTAIDDVNLTWTGTVSVAVSDVNAIPALAFGVLGEPTSDKVTFSYNAEETGVYNFSIYDLTGRTIRTEAINAKSGDEQLTVNGLNLAPGMYFAKMSNGNSSSVARFVIN